MNLWGSKQFINFWNIMFCIMISRPLAFYQPNNLNILHWECPMLGWNKGKKIAARCCAWSWSWHLNWESIPSVFIVATLLGPRQLGEERSCGDSGGVLRCGYQSKMIVEKIVNNNVSDYCHNHAQGKGISLFLDIVSQLVWIRNCWNTRFIKKVR